MEQDRIGRTAYLLKTVRVGLVATWMTVAGLAVYLVLDRDEVEAGAFVMLAAAVVGAAVVAMLPWQRMLAGAVGNVALYAWSILDILLITGLLAFTGGPDSKLFILYALTTVFLAASYPVAAQAVLLTFTLAAYLTVAVVQGWDLSLPATVARFATLAALAYIASFLSRELMRQNETLAQEVALHELAERSLVHSREQLSQAQALVHLGSWDWNVVDDELYWSDEMVRIFGLDPDSFEGTYATFIEGVHPDDRDEVHQIIRRAFDTCEPFEFEHRLVRPDGTIRHLRAQGKVEAGPDGRPVRMFGTGLDITERKRLEQNEMRVQELLFKRRQALQIHDQIVQGLAVTQYALELGHRDRADEALRKTMSSAQTLISDLLDRDEPITGGDLLRDSAAVVVEPEELDDDTGSDVA